MPSRRMKVEIWADLFCPWCYIGKRRWEAALASFPHADAVDVVWRSFQLDPRAPRVFPGSADERLARKYGIPLEQAQAMHARTTKVAAEEGLTYRFDLARPGNSLDAHRLVHLAAERGLADAIEERLFRAYFTEGIDTADHDRLAALAGEAGLDAAAARAMLESDRFVDDVQADQRRAAEIGFDGVPAFLIGERYAVVGAQPPPLLRQALDAAWNEA